MCVGPGTESQTKTLLVLVLGPLQTRVPQYPYSTPVVRLPTLPPFPEAFLDTPSLSDRSHLGSDTTHVERRNRRTYGATNRVLGPRDSGETSWRKILETWDHPVK